MFTKYVKLISYNQYSVGIKGGYKQLVNDEESIFILRYTQDHVISLESIDYPDLFLGIGSHTRHDLVGSGDPNLQRGFRAQLVKPDGTKEQLCIRYCNGNSDNGCFIRLESRFNPGYFLNHCCGKQWFFDEPVNNEITFVMDSSWKFEYVTVERNNVFVSTPTNSNFKQSSSDINKVFEDLQKKYEESQEQLEQELNCSICYVNKKDHAIIPCGHVFCESCIKRSGNTWCPSCRKIIQRSIKLFL
ncbi:RING-finger domain-containing protein [Tetraselmis virus 1]|uniref:RING-finger domain-containing protein n=1 Tax=Tetraselmis virus 1 TaxID=2060617 RepID=A0A2P0VNP5_9VIRU|nr:RING-finger domain-containing protein [Tetraselmis virus 1]AUF82502.1 RING-finger domain-containing protein [Tetraselmis virus 1]